MAPLITATLPLQSCRMFSSLDRLGNASVLTRIRPRLAGRRQPVHHDGARLRAAVEANSAAGAVMSGVARGMHSQRAQLGLQLQTSRRTALDTKSAPLALLHINCDFPSCWPCHGSHLVAASLAIGRCNHLVFSQYAYSSSRNWGWAISINALARSRMLLPWRYATPYSVTT